MSDVADPAPAAFALVERSIARLAAAVLDLARSNAWNDLLGTIDRLAVLLGADVGPAVEPVPTDVDPAQIGRLAAAWVKSLVLPEYLERSAPGRAHYRVRLPPEARADGLGDLADFLESLEMRLDLSVEGGTARLSLSVGGGDRPAVSATCAPARLEVDLDLDATRGALRHMVALVERVPAARRAAPGLVLEKLSGVVRLSFAASDGRMQLAGALNEAMLLSGTTDQGPFRIEIGPSHLLAIEGEAGGTLSARVQIGAVEARLPAAMVDAEKAGTAEYRLTGAGGRMDAAHGERTLALRELTLGGQPAVARRDGTVVESVELLGGRADFDLEPLEPGRFVLAAQSEVSLRLGPPGKAVTLSVPAGTRLEMLPGRLLVQKGRLLLVGAGANAAIEVLEGRALVRRQEARPGERHLILRFYEGVGAA